MHVQLQFLFEIKYNFWNKKAIFTSKKKNPSDELTTALDKLLVNFLNFLSFTFQPCILPFLQPTDGRAFRKQFPIPFLKTHMRIVQCIMFYKQKFSIRSPLTGKQVHQVGAESKTHPPGCSWRVVTQQGISGPLIHTWRTCLAKANHWNTDVDHCQKRQQPLSIRAKSTRMMNGLKRKIRRTSQED